MQYIGLFLLICSVSGGDQCPTTDVYGFCAYSIYPEDESQLQLLQGIRSYSNVIFLSEPLWIGTVVDMMVPYGQVGFFNELIAEYGIKSFVKDENQQRYATVILIMEAGAILLQRLGKLFFL